MHLGHTGGPAEAGSLEGVGDGQHERLLVGHLGKIVHPGFILLLGGDGDGDGDGLLALLTPEDLSCSETLVIYGALLFDTRREAFGLGYAHYR